MERRQARRTLGQIPASPRSAQAHELHSVLSGYRSRISALESTAADLLAEHAALESELRAASEPALDGLRTQIAALEQSAASLRRQIEANRSHMGRVDAETAALQAERAPPAAPSAARERLFGLEAELATVKQAIASTEQRSLAWNRKLEALQPLEWLGRREQVRAEIAECRRSLAATQSETEAVEREIAEIERRRKVALGVYEKWRGLSPKRASSSDSWEALVPEVEKVGGEVKGDVSELQMQLHQAVEENEQIRDEIARLRRVSLGKARKMPQAVAEMRRQTADAYDRAVKEEQRLIQKIIAAGQKM
jgi:predicted  nucleic acid-binding Zn-ribbon protein